MGKLFDLIKEDEKRAMWNYIKDYGPSGDNDPRTGRRAPLSEVLRPWEEAKEKFLGKIFKDSLIISKEINYKANPDSIVQEVEYNEAIRGFIKDFKAWMRSPETKDIFRDPGERWYADSLITSFALANNRYDEIEIRVKDPRKPNGWIQIANGCKPVRILGKLNDAYHFSNRFEEFRIAHSMILNKKELKGNLCISIHPFDFITMSDNDCNWESCMNWRETGSYRQGTVEMMNSPCVVLAYLTASEPMQLRHGDEWNNKKWRSLYIVNREVIINVKGYPYQMPDLDKMVISVLKDLVEQNYNINYNNVEPYCYNRRLNFHFQTNHMYNDFGSLDENFACIAKDVINRPIHIKYSGVSECMWCGEVEPYLENDDQVFCDDCEGGLKCACCGDRYYGDDLIETADGSLVCEYCLADYYDKDWEGNFYRTDGMTLISVMPKELKPYIESGALVPRRHSDEPSGFYINYYIDPNKWAKDSDLSKSIIEEVECTYLKDDCHFKVITEKHGWWTYYCPYCFEDELQDDVKEGFHENKIRLTSDNLVIKNYIDDVDSWTNENERLAALEKLLPTTEEPKMDPIFF